MNIYSIGPLIVSILTFFFGLFAYLKNRDAKLNRLFGLLCLSVSVWSFGYSQMYNTKNNDFIALTWARIGYCGVVFIPAFVWHYIITFLGVKRHKSVVFFVYLFAFIFLVISRTNLFLYGMYTSYFWGYYPKAGPLYIYFVAFFFWIFLRVVFLLLLELLRKKNELLPAQINKIKYLLLGFVIATTSIIDYVQNYGIEIYPWGYLSAFGWLACMGWASFKYRLMDINLVLTRAGIFAVVYTLVLGIPLGLTGWGKHWLQGLFGVNWYWASVILAIILATIGPFLYIWLDRRAEEKLLKEQRRYQNTLKQATAGMTRIRNLRKLLDLIAHIVTKTVKISYVGIYLFNKEKNEFVLQVCRDKGRTPVSKITPDNPVVAYFSHRQLPLVCEEIKEQAQGIPNSVNYKQIEENMRLLTATVIIPSFLEDRLLGFIVLGDKLSRHIYTLEDLDVFQILASQAALAIENAQFYEEAKLMQEQIAQAEKMATIGTMADGMSHQINNRFYALSLIAADTIDTINMTDISNCSPEVKAAFSQITRALDRVKVNVIQGGEVVKGLLKYTRKGDEGFEPLAMDQILDSALEMVQYKVNLSEIDILRNYPKDHPKIKGNLVQLQEVFFNFIDNAYDAINERKEILKEEGFRGRISFSVQPKENILEITIEDNGMGIKDDCAKKVFTPFFTTKVSSRRGTGLGLYVINKIITDTHKGKLAFESMYGKGTRFIVELPLANA